MKVYTIDFSKCKAYMQFFEEIIKITGLLANIAQ